MNAVSSGFFVIRYLTSGVVNHRIEKIMTIIRGMEVRNKIISKYICIPLVSNSFCFY